MLPETTITSGPLGTINSTSASFSFASSEPRSTFMCSLDDAAFDLCTSPTSYNDLSSEPHTFQVRAIDAAGNSDPTPESRTWTVDTTT
jgi:large repetitive protein